MSDVIQVPAAPLSSRRELAAFRSDVRQHRALSTAKALWWTTQRAAGRAMMGPRAAEADAGAGPDPTSPPPSAESARRYEAQVETLFSGAAGAMRRRALSLLATAWRERDQRELRVVDVACGSGAFLADRKSAFPRASVSGVDLSHAYAREASTRSATPTAQASAERLPFADASLDGVSCIYLFHELPPRVRSKVAAELARVLKPGGVLAFADSIQGVDAPDLDRLLQAFPAFFHEPYYTTYQSTDLPALFAGAGMALEAQDQAFLTKALLLRKAPTPAA